MYLKSLSPEQTSELVTFFAGKFRGNLPFDELLLMPTTAARFVQDYIWHARIWGTPEHVILRALRDALKNDVRGREQSV